MINHIRLEYFKCFRKIEVDPRLITVFVGPNGTGKSSVLQALALLKQSLQSNGISHRGRLLQLSDRSELLPKFQPASSTTRLEFAGLSEIYDATSLGFGNEVTFRYCVDLVDMGSPVYSGELEFLFEDRPVLIDSPSGHTNVTFGSHIANIAPASVIGQICEMMGWRTPAGPIMDSVFANILGAPASTLTNLRFVPAVRGLGKPSYRPGDELIQDVMPSGGLGAQEEQTATNLSYSRRLENKISEWSKAVTGVGLKMNPVPPQSIEFLAETPVGDVNIVIEGFGNNALIFLFMQLASVRNSATVLIEEPEIHLHPRAQAELASLLAEEAKASDKQLIMTTHSEHLLGRFLTLVAEGKLSNKDIAIYAFEKAEDGECSAQELEVTDDGRVKGGIKDFFESDLEELDRYIKALQPGE